MPCYRSGGCGPYENLSCSVCPASRPEYNPERAKQELTPKPIGIPRGVSGSYIKKDRVIELIREQFPPESYTAYDPRLCKRCGGLASWNSHFQGWYCSQCGDVYKPPKVDHPVVKKLIEAIQAEPDVKIQ